jgi:hypothetical protein
MSVGQAVRLTYVVESSAGYKNLELDPPSGVVYWSGGIVPKDGCYGSIRITRVP